MALPTKDRTGETKVMNNGLTAKIIRYKNNRDIDIEFTDVNQVVKNKHYIAFSKGNIKCPLIVKEFDDYVSVTNVNCNPKVTFLIDKIDVERVIDRWWCITNNGYVIGKNMASGKNELLHRFIMDAPPDKLVDHESMDKLDCRRSNLRICDKPENSMNRGKQANNTTGYKGVIWDKKKQKYRSEIKHGKAKEFLGYRETAIESARDYNEAALKYHGEFAKLNDVK